MIKALFKKREKYTESDRTMFIRKRAFNGDGNEAVYNVRADVPSRDAWLTYAYGVNGAWFF